MKKVNKNSNYSEQFDKLLKNRFALSMILDLYALAMTKRQFEILSLRLNEDLSVNEIAKNLKISRQSVYEHIAARIMKISNFEKKLHLLETLITFNKKMSRSGIGQNSAQKNMLSELESVLSVIG